MKCLVTGAAGFIGSHLCDQLLRGGHEVIAVDAFIPYYPREVKERNQSEALSQRNYSFHATDLRTTAIGPLVADVDVVFHLAAMPGLARSWTDFDLYLTCNVHATQRLLEAVRQANRKIRLVYASTSSVYGRFSSGDETLPAKPISPYGVTKFAAENLCRAYAHAYELHIVVLRYFSVYGPRQRPDMGYHRFVDALLREQPIVVYGDGQQSRGNTYVADCVQATLAAIEAPAGEVYNVGGGEVANVWEILKRLQTLTGREPIVRQEPARPGDQRHTFAETRKIRNHLGWQPRTSLDEGLAAQVAWQRLDLGERRE